LLNETLSNKRAKCGLGFTLQKSIVELYGASHFAVQEYPLAQIVGCAVAQYAKVGIDRE
jgi:hypothetical protein